MSEAFTLLSESGGAPKRTLPPSAALLAAQQTITSLYEQWDDDLIASRATELILHVSAECSKISHSNGAPGEFEALRKSFGKCPPTTPIEPEDALRGRWSCAAEKGASKCS